jgi:EAL domain-containing protein (putative c-di-GMP-specific phosphodiesterase class I)
MIDIAHRLGKKTVAEYVERESTLELLKNYGVDYIQGFLIGRPQAQIEH